MINELTPDRLLEAIRSEFEALVDGAREAILYRVSSMTAPEEWSYSDRCDAASIALLLRDLRTMTSVSLRIGLLPYQPVTSELEKKAADKCDRSDCRCSCRFCKDDSGDVNPPLCCH